MPEKPDRAKFITWIDDDPPLEVDRGKLPPVEPYKTIEDVPVPLRHTLRQAHESGLTVMQLAQVFELPPEWIEIFVKPDDANTH